MVDFTEDELEEIIFSIVAYAGEAKGCAHQALAFAEEGKFEEAEECMKECDAAVLKAHHVQTDMIQKEAGGQKIPLSIVFENRFTLRVVCSQIRYQGSLRFI